MSDDDKSSQSEEIETLTSIFYPEEIQNQQVNGLNTITFWAACSLPDDYPIRYIDSESIPRTLHVKYLPPIRLNLRLPTNYPSQKPPSFKIQCEWLSSDHLKKIAAQFQTIWNEQKQSPIVYTWIQFLKFEVLDFLNLSKELSLEFLSSSNEDDDTKLGHLPTVDASSSSTATVSSSNSCDRSELVNGIDGNNLDLIAKLVQIIEAFDREQKKADFLKDCHECKICFSDKLGKDSILFEKCGHIFCRECLMNYFTVLINSGNMMGIKCPAYKCDTEANQSQVRELLPAELFEKYDKTLLLTMLDASADIVYCPRTICQYPVTWDREEKVAVCPHCDYAFCVLCRMVYHGVEPCRFKDEEQKKWIDCYHNGTPEQRRQLELRFGKKQLDTLVNAALSECWIKENGKNCPHCKVVIEKSDGCNKMTCFRCQKFFCWLCGSRLDQFEPYLHFRDPKSPCNNKLFPMFEDDDEWNGGWEDIEVDSGESDIEAPDTD